MQSRENNTLKESEEQLRLIFEHTNEIIVVTEDEKVVFCNPQITELTRYSIDEVYSMNFMDFIHRDDMKVVKKEYQSRISGKKLKNRYPIRIITKDEQEKFVLVSSSLMNWKGKPASLVVLTDITEKRKMEEKLQLSEKRLSLIFESVAEILYYIRVEPDECYHFLSVNPAFLNATGLTEEQVVGKRVEEVIPETVIRMVLDNYKKSIEEKSIVRWEETVFYPIGKKTGVVSIAPVFNEGGICTYLVGSVHDITNRKQAEEEVIKSEERFRSLMEESPLAIEILTPEGKISQVNGAWLKLWGINKEEAEEVLSSYNMLTDPQIKERGIESLVEKAFNGERVVLPPIEYNGDRTADDFGLEFGGNTVWIQCHLYSVKDQNGDIEYVVNTYMDITELKRAEAETSRNKNILARVSRATKMGQLAGAISHELNQPLTGILSNAQAAELIIKSGKWKSEDIMEILDDIVADAKRGGAVIRNLRELYQGQQVEISSFDMNELVNETIQLLHSEIVKEHIEVDVESNSSVTTLKGNKVQIQQVVVNLIMNSIQAMEKNDKKNRRIEILIKCSDIEISTFVVDTGPGIEEDRIDHIFEPLVTWKPSGTGMGLAISNSIVESHGGRMWVENRQEGGTLIGFSIPFIKQNLKND